MRSIGQLYKGYFISHFCVIFFFLNPIFKMIRKKKNIVERCLVVCNWKSGAVPAMKFLAIAGRLVLFGLKCQNLGGI